MANVVEFHRKEPHLSGPAKCIGCGHAWVAVAPVGTVVLECPSCGTERGVLIHLIGAQEGDLGFTCKCGSDVLTAYKRAGKFWLQCMCCGLDQTEAIFG